MSSTSCTISIWLESKTTLADRVAAIELLIDKMILKIGESLDDKNVTIERYWLRDGQMDIQTTYRTLDDIYKSVTTLERMKQMYLNRLNGRSFVLRDARGLT